MKSSKNTEKAADYYVYVYIDPRNFEEFYYGKGIRNRKNAHLKDDRDSEKTKRINAIKKEGLTPIIKVIAKDLMENEAYLIEKTLIWKLGRTLTNKSSGHFADKFRPHDSFHLDLFGFDYKNGFYHVNIGEGPFRCWDDCKRYGFLSAGQDPKYSNPLKTLEVGDIVVAYLKKKGYVGIGRVTSKAVGVDEFMLKNKSINPDSLKQKGIFINADNERSEHLVKIEWIKSFDSSEAKWKKKSGLYTPELIKATLQNQPKTIKFLEEEFDIKISDLLQPKAKTCISNSNSFEAFKNVTY